MCGIFGINSTTHSAASLNEAAATLYSRGPDSQNWEARNGFCLGICRLAIVGVLDGNQPVVGRKSSAVFNGEIFNYRELAQKHRVAAVNHSDSGIIPGLFETLGLEFVHELEGMFAIALWDEVEGELHLVRDRFGKKPLYWGQIEDRFAFGSRIDSVEKLLGMPPRRAENLNGEWLYSYLRFGHGEHLKSTVNNLIYRVPPGHMVTFSQRNGTVITKRWFESNLERASQSDRGRFNVASMWQSLLSAASERIPSEVPFVIQLSAGIDSSLVAAAVAEVGAKPAFALTVGNHNQEAALAAELSRALGFRHRTIQFPKADAQARLVLESIDSNDEPFWDGMVPSFFINREISKHAKVALSGDGPDELFGGYARTRLALQAGQFGWLAGLASALPFPAHEKFEGISSYARFARNFRYSVAGQLWLLSAVQDSSLKSIFDHPQERLVEVIKSLDGWPFRSLATGVFSTEIWLSLSQILKKVDASSMANSVEVRSPFLANGFLDLGSEFYQRPLISRGIFAGKSPLRKLGKSLLPPQHLKRAKTGFGFGILPLLDNELRTDWDEMTSARGSLVTALSNIANSPTDQVRGFINGSNSQTKGRLFALGRYLGY